ncbi:translation factor Sua5 [Ectothiorhodospira haloalkaliphila]|uniref:Translation factor Sua5 n=1 Tax=Ectothiorhodospira haloalkaliphila TaxID=421628 RepID=W8KK21_9GAMM|nr:L-threonylcarbamoyladenylate synthase [Ectothiorhodospira haloalkaliphila]AHK79508.1 translation factor Sua5 [Ectothiorhodospira haloalkaliphila]MCG5498273.1 threonylcarbamoyl-AMP synthase [Ectothiorhodospira variabilis]MCG5525545.1 threonylcarbamoyl-AMP synthase [Ectothiorhodospira haloalkaliphila]
MIEIHPVDPQARLIRQAADVVLEGGVIVYPTDSCYALGCAMGNKAGMERIRRIRQLDEQYHLTLVCRDLSEISVYAKVDNTAYRLLKALTPGPYAFLLKATHEVPRRLQHPKRKTVGLRIPDNPICNALLEAVGQPLMSSTLELPGDDHPMSDTFEIRERMMPLVDLVIDGGACSLEPTTVIDLEGDVPRLMRRGRGEVPPGLEE